MRWDALRLDDAPGQETGDTAAQDAATGARPDDAGGASTVRPPALRRADAVPALFGRDVVAKTFDTPGFRGMTFYEVHAKSIINKVPASSRMPFHWTINPYRGCGHGCVYCFARNTHTYLDLDAGHDFDSKVVVKVNAPELTRRALAAPRWPGEHVAMGTNVDCYQRAEGRYQLMPGIIGALRDARNPFSILTKGTLILRDLDLIAEAADVTDVGLNVSVGFIDKELSRLAEPGTPSPRRRLGVCAALSDRGLRCGVLMGPVLPFLSDSPAQLAAAVREAAAAGATSVTPIVLHLRPGAREWFQRWLGEHYPDLVAAYRELYGSGSYAARGYQERITQEVRDLARQYRVGSRSPAQARRVGGAARPGRSPGPGRGIGMAGPEERRSAAEAVAEPAAVQLTLL
jgi:DNA repair photolyase